MTYERYSAWLKEQTPARLTEEYTKTVAASEAATSVRSKAAWSRMADLVKVELQRREM